MYAVRKETSKIVACLTQALADAHITYSLVVNSAGMVTSFCGLRNESTNIVGMRERKNQRRQKNHE